MKKGRVTLRVLRAQQGDKGITQSEVARRAQAVLPNGQTMSMQRYWQIENGEGSEPSDDEKAAVAVALDAKVIDIAWPDLLKARTA